VSHIAFELSNKSEFTVLTVSGMLRRSGKKGKEDNVPKVG